MRKAGLILAMTLALGACAEPKLRLLDRSGDGPDEFLIVPALPLEQPESFSSLPTPTPGGANRTDQRPMSDIAAALGGQATSASAPVPGADAGFVNYVARAGLDPQIRQRLAEEDADFRKGKARFTNFRLFPEDRYVQAYRRQIIDPFDVADDLRRAGIPVPSAPPRRGR